MFSLSAGFNCLQAALSGCGKAGWYMGMSICAINEVMKGVTSTLDSCPQPTCHGDCLLLAQILKHVLNSLTLCELTFGALTTETEIY